jgi:hypothetical protein
MLTIDYCHFMIYVLFKDGPIYHCSLPETSQSSCRKHTSLSLHDFLSTDCCYWLLYNKLQITNTIRQKTTENNNTNLHTQYWNTPAASGKHLTVWLLSMQLLPKSKLFSWVDNSTFQWMWHDETPYTAVLTTSNPCLRSHSCSEPNKYLGQSL